MQSVWVEPEARGQGVFRTMYAHVRSLARHTPGVCGLRLYVEKSNASARAVYERCGMRPAAYDIYEEDFVLGRNH
ncbi:MAG: GNAT family N-acetyltransferase [Bryobacteraceae bacterium]|nr:GNAT family N-acetyltransferase [Bryobacteraceae bacterium]